MGKKDREIVYFEKEYCGEAVAQYSKVSSKDLIPKAKKHLSAVGWTFYYQKKGNGRELRYQSPNGTVFYSLLTACRWYVSDHAEIHNQDMETNVPTDSARDSRPDFDEEEQLVIANYGDGGTWTRGRLIGEGDFGAVFLATSKGHCSTLPLPPVIAVKSADISHSYSLKHERSVLSSLVGCPHILQCFGAEITRKTDGSRVYNLLLEFASGGTLHDRVLSSKGRGLPESEVRWYTRSIVRGLYKIHQAGYVHCDLKPENILLVPTIQKGHEFKAKICDFGLAKGATEDRRKNKFDRRWNGTPLYVSPEAVKDGLQEPPGDIWSLGILVLEMLTGRPAWDLEQGSGSEAEKVIQKLEKGSLPKIPKHLSPVAKNFLNLCLRRMVKNRATAKSLCQHPFIPALDDDNDVSVVRPGWLDQELKTP